MVPSGVVPFLQEHIHWAPCKWSDFEGLTMSCLCGNDTFCEGLPGAIPQNSDHGEALWNFFLGYDSFRKSTTPLPIMKNRV